MGKNGKVLYRITGREREQLAQAHARVVEAMGAYRALLTFIAQREGLPSGVTFDEAQFAFLRTPAPPERAAPSAVATKEG